MKIGFIGLGIMGKAMAVNLAKANGSCDHDAAEFSAGKGSHARRRRTWREDARRTGIH